MPYFYIDWNLIETDSDKFNSLQAKESIQAFIFFFRNSVLRAGQATKQMCISSSALQCGGAMQRCCSNRQHHCMSNKKMFVIPDKFSMVASGSSACCVIWTVLVGLQAAGTDVNLADSWHCGEGGPVQWSVAVLRGWRRTCLSGWSSCRATARSGRRRRQVGLTH